jgi:hypothetical protein
MSAEPRDSVAQAIDAAVDRALRQQEQEFLARYGSLCGTATGAGSRLTVEEVERAITKALREADAADGIAAAVAKERAEILDLLDSMTTEWRPTPGGMVQHSPFEVSSRSGKVQGGGGHIRYPATLPTPEEKAVLAEAAKRIRARK